VIAIREARPDEAPVITGVINRAYEVEAFFKIGDRTDEPEIARYLQKDTFLVAEDESRIVGAVRVKNHGSEGHFGMLAVDPSAQGSGLGRLLVGAAESWATERGCTSMWLEVVNLREELPPWYRKLGYEVAGTQPWPGDSLERVSRQVHFIIMSKQLAARVPVGEAGR
jgi:ribosomal protein S18 acetylase RimI-like enzyme